MQNTIIRTYHDEVGYVGTEKVAELISRSYYFPNVRDKIKNYIANCLKCITYAPISGKPEGYLHSIPKGNLPFDTLHIDHYGPLEKTRRKNKYILLVVDGFTKFVKLYATKTVNSEEAIKHLKGYFSYYSRPNRIVSDRGTAFTSGAFEKFLSDYEIKHILIATGMPRANGQAERINLVVNAVLSKICSSAEKWDEFLLEVEYSINNTVCRSIKETPSRLLFGINQRGKLIDNLQDVINLSDNEDRNLEEIRRESTEQQIRTQNQNKQYFDKKRKEARNYEVGDKVMITNHDVTPGVNKKLIPKFKGPYEVVKKIDNDRYLVRDIEGFQVTSRPFQGFFHPSQMKPYPSYPFETDN